MKGPYLTADELKRVAFVYPRNVVQNNPAAEYLAQVTMTLRGDNIEAVIRRTAGRIEKMNKVTQRDVAQIIGILQQTIADLPARVLA